MSHELFYQHIKSIRNETMGEGFDFIVIIIYDTGMACIARKLNSLDFYLNGNQVNRVERWI